MIELGYRVVLLRYLIILLLQGLQIQLLLLRRVVAITTITKLSSESSIGKPSSLARIRDMWDQFDEKTSGCPLVALKKTCTEMRVNKSCPKFLTLQVVDRSGVQSLRVLAMIRLGG